MGKEGTQVWSAQLSQSHFPFFTSDDNAPHIEFPNSYGELRGKLKRLLGLDIWFQG